MLRGALVYELSHANPGYRAFRLSALCAFWRRGIRECQRGGENQAVAFAFCRQARGTRRPCAAAPADRGRGREQQRDAGGEFV